MLIKILVISQILINIQFNILIFKIYILFIFYSKYFFTLFSLISFDSPTMNIILTYIIIIIRIDI